MKSLLIFLLTLSIATGLYAQNSKKPQVIVMTDGEVDDRSSMVRFLMYSCDMNIRGIIQTNSIYQKTGTIKKVGTRNS